MEGSGSLRVRRFTGSGLFPIVSIFLIFASAPCAAALAPDYPLEPGTRWTFHLHQEFGPGVHPGAAIQKLMQGGDAFDATVVSRVAGVDDIGGQRYTRIESTLPQMPWLIEWMRLAPDGLLLGKTIDAEDGEEHFMNPPQRLLSATLRAGEAWDWQASDGPVSIQTRVVGPASVQVPAGSFDAVKIVLDMTVQTGGAPVQVLQSRWFVPGVGYVEEETQSVLAGHRLSHVVLTLEKFEPGSAAVPRPAPPPAVFTGAAVAPVPAPAPPPPAAALLGEPQDTDIAGVTAQLAYARQYDGVLHVGVVLENTNDREVNADHPLEYSELLVVSATANRKYFPLKDAAGNYLGGPVESRINGGRWDVRLVPHSRALLWALFDAVPADGEISFQGPVFHSFDHVRVTEGPPPGVREVESSLPPLRARLLSAERAGGELKVRLAILHPPGVRPVNRVVEYSDVYVLDPQGRRSYPLLKDAAGVFVASPFDSKVNGGRFPLYKVGEGGQQLMDLTFPAPPDSVGRVDVVVPWFAPFEAVALTGQGGGAVSGRAVTGGSAVLERALADLNADVTAEQVKVNLSADLLFDFDSADIKPAAGPQLEKVATVVKAYPGAQISIEGHSDGKGAADYNQRLSERRADTVADWLVVHAGLDRANLHTRGWGMTRPVAPNTRPDGSDDPEGRAKNRRVEIVVRRR